MIKKSKIKNIKVFYDLETTGVDVKKHSIHQLAGLIELDGEIVEEFDIKSRPHPKAIIEQEALNVGGVTEKQILMYPAMGTAHCKFLGILNKYIDRYNPKQKAYLIGYNNRAFDDIFLRAWFEQNGDKYIGSWFWNDTHDALMTASIYLEGERRRQMVNFKQGTVAKELGIYVEDSKLHDALYDVKLTRQIYRITRGLDFEI